MELFGWFEYNFTSPDTYVGTFGNSAGTNNQQLGDGLVHEEIGIRRNSQFSPPFGIYDAIWKQAGTQVTHLLTLEILPLQANPQAFLLLWTNRDNVLEFHGVGNLITSTRMLGWYRIPTPEQRNAR